MDKIREGIEFTVLLKSRLFSPRKFEVFIFKIYSLTVPGLHCYTWAFSTCGKQGLPSSCSSQASHCSDFSSWGAQTLGTWAQ